MDLVFGASRVMHVAAVLSAAVLMFLPTATRYFRLARADRSRQHSDLRPRFGGEAG